MVELSFCDGITKLVGFGNVGTMTNLVRQDNRLAIDERRSLGLPVPEERVPSPNHCVRYRIRIHLYECDSPGAVVSYPVNEPADVFVYLNLIPILKQNQHVQKVIREYLEPFTGSVLDNNGMVFDQKKADEILIAYLFDRKKPEDLKILNKAVVEKVVKHKTELAETLKEILKFSVECFIEDTDARRGTLRHELDHVLFCTQTELYRQYYLSQWGTYDVVLNETRLKYAEEALEKLCDAYPLLEVRASLFSSVRLGEWRHADYENIRERILEAFGGKIIDHRIRYWLGAINYLKARGNGPPDLDKLKTHHDAAFNQKFEPPKKMLDELRRKADVCFWPIANAMRDNPSLFVEATKAETFDEYVAALKQ